LRAANRSASDLPAKRAEASGVPAKITVVAIADDFMVDGVETILNSTLRAHIRPLSTLTKVGVQKKEVHHIQSCTVMMNSLR